MLSSLIWRRAAIAALLCLGVGLLLKASYIPAKALMAKGLIAQAWSKTLDEGGVHLPWSWADHWPVGRLVFSNLNKDHIVLAGAQGASLAFGPGSMTGYAQPGTAGLSIIGGHRDTHFQFLKDVKVGDWFRLQTPVGQWQDYAIFSAEIVDSRDAHLPVYEHGETVLALVTCYPFEALIPGGPLRYVVSARMTQSL